MSTKTNKKNSSGGERQAMTGWSELGKMWLQFDLLFHIGISSDSAILKTWQKNIDLIMLIILIIRVTKENMDSLTEKESYSGPNSA